MATDTVDVVALTSDVVPAYVQNNRIPSSEVPKLIETVHAALAKQMGRSQEVTAKETPRGPAVAVKKSIAPDYIFCLEDGQKFRSLKRHLSTHHDMTPEQYRAKWQLPPDYPMVAPSYAAARSEFARKMGLGRLRKKGKHAAAPATRKARKPPA